MKQKIFRLTDDDIANLDAIRSRENLPDDTKALRFALVYTANTKMNIGMDFAVGADKSVLFPAPVKKRKYDDLYIQNWIERNSSGFPKTKCPLHDIEIWSCKCIEKNREALVNWFREQYE